MSKKEACGDWLVKESKAKLSARAGGTYQDMTTQARPGIIITLLVVSKLSIADSQLIKNADNHWKLKLL